MMQYRITHLAYNDMQGIWDYTIKQWSQQQAEKYIDGLLGCFDAIAQGVMQSKVVDHLRYGYKKALYERHIIFFRTAPDQVTEIIRVLHVSMDIKSHLE